MAISTEEHAQAAFDASFDAAFADEPTPTAPATPEPSAAEPAAAPAEPEVKTEAPAAGPPPTQPSAEAAPKRRSDYEDWIGKYGGDKDKAASESWRMTRENARLAKELEDARQRQAQAETPAAPVEPEIPQEIQAIDDELRAVQATSVELLKEGGYYRQQASLYDRAIHQKSGEIRTLSAQLARGGMELEQETVLRQKLSAAHQELEGYEQNKAGFDREVSRTNFEAARLVDSHKHLIRSKEQSERYLRLEQARAADDKRAYDAEVARDANAADQNLRTQATELGIEPGKPGEPSDDFVAFKEFVLAPIVAKLRSMEDAGNYDGLPADQIQAEISERIGRYKASQDRTFQARSAKLTKTKEQQMAVEGPTGKDAVATPGARRRPSEQELYDSLEF